ncbi:MAG: hypothetical protein IAG13_21070 [Deltaproteobacteria bacterium]|nr:hypothetical protein [Nannocystaceae bacterium]
MAKATAVDPVEVELEDQEHEQGELDEAALPFGDQLESLGNNVTQFVVERPLAAVGIALGVGFLLGRLFRS